MYYKHSGNIIGYTDLGDVNNHLLALEHSIDNKRPEPAKSMLHGQRFVHWFKISMCTIFMHKAHQLWPHIMIAAAVLISSNVVVTEVPYPV